MGAQEKAAVAPKSALRFERAIEMPGVEGRIDHMAFDGSALFVAALENGTVEHLVVEPGRVRASLQEPQVPCAVVCAGGRIYVTDARQGAVWCISDIDSKDFFPPTSKSKSVEIGPDADNMRFLLNTSTLLVGYGDGGLGWIGLKEFTVAARVELGGHPESFQVDSAEKRCWVNVPDKKSIAVVDLETKKVARWIELKTAKKNYPMALAEKDKRVIIGCREPARLLLFDMETDAPVGDLPLSGDVDDIFLDEERGLLYASCGAGFVDVFERKAPTVWLPMEKVATAPGARTCLFVPAEKKLFVAVPHRGEQKAEVRVFSTAP